MGGCCPTRGGEAGGAESAQGSLLSGKQKEPHSPPAAASRGRSSRRNLSQSPSSTSRSASGMYRPIADTPKPEARVHPVGSFIEIVHMRPPYDNLNGLRGAVSAVGKRPDGRTVVQIDLERWDTGEEQQIKVLPKNTRLIAARDEPGAVIEVHSLDSQRNLNGLRGKVKSVVSLGEGKNAMRMMRVELDNGMQTTLLPENTRVVVDTPSGTPFSSPEGTPRGSDFNPMDFSFSEPNKPRRVDPTDGNAYTKAEFVEQYGGLGEWEEALPALEAAPEVLTLPSRRKQQRGSTSSMPGSGSTRGSIGKAAFQDSLLKGSLLKRAAAAAAPAEVPGSPATGSRPRGWVDPYVRHGWLAGEEQRGKV